MLHIVFLLYFYACGGVGFAITEDIDLSVAHHLLCCGIVVYAGWVEGSGAAVEMGNEGEAEILKIGSFCGAEVVRRCFDGGSTVVRQRWLFINGYEIERNSLFLRCKVKGYIQAVTGKRHTKGCV